LLAAAEACGDAQTRYAAYSCIHGFGHAFMRMNLEQLGCPKLSTPDARKGCAAGVNGMADGPLITFS
jgi:hypothetical protein